MKPHAEYEIKIIDPVTGEADHEVFRHYFNGRDKLKDHHKFVYNLARLINRTKYRKAYKDLDFFISTKKSTILMFEITAPGWKFKKIDAITHNCKAHKEVLIDRRSDTELHVEVPGSKRIGLDEFDYSLHYIEPKGDDFEFDPIINNGSLPPSLRHLFLRLALISSLISAALATTFVATLIKLGII